MNLNTPDRIVTRKEGARFYCADCRKTYQQCKCVVYRSADTIRQGKSGMPRPGARHPRDDWKAVYCVKVIV